ncbi:protein N-terminal asparagine amidohydrolase isoform X1 [Lissotriton helveticus]
MPLLIDSQRINLSLTVAQLVEMHPRLKEGARNLTSKPSQTVEAKGFLYVQQREFAVTTPKDSSVSFLGSEDATTCHILVLKHTGSGATCLAHLDGSDTKAEVTTITSSVKSFSSNAADGRLEVHLVGGFNDDRRLSQKLTSQLLNSLDQQKDEIHLVTLCVSELNDKLEDDVHLPIIYGIAVNVKTGDLFPATFQDKGPEEDLRSARSFTGGPMINIYDAKTELLNIGPYYWRPSPYAYFWLEQDDERILQNLSTSPLAEPPHFVAHMRSTMMFLKNNPEPQNFLFPDKKPRTYKKNESGLWESVVGGTDLNKAEEVYS